MDNSLFTTLEVWLQGRINTCVQGLLDRVERLEIERNNADAVIRSLSRSIEQLEDPETFRDSVRDIVAEYVENCDKLLTYQALKDTLEDMTFKIHVR